MLLRQRRRGCPALARPVPFETASCLTVPAPTASQTGPECVSWSGLPQVMAGVRQCLSIGLILMVISEMFASSSGLGFAIVQFQPRPREGAREKAFVALILDAPEDFVSNVFVVTSFSEAIGHGALRCWTAGGRSSVSLRTRQRVASRGDSASGGTGTDRSCGWRPSHSSNRRQQSGSRSPVRVDRLEIHSGPFTLRHRDTVVGLLREDT